MISLHKSSARHRRAFTLTELAIVLGVISAVLGVIWVASSNVYENQRTQRATQDYQTVVANFRSLFANKAMDIADNTSLNNFAIQNSLVPTDMLVSGSTTSLINPWKGAVTITAQKTQNGVVMSYATLDKAGCNHFATALAANPMLISETINSTTRTFAPYGTAASFTVSDVNTACSLSTGNTVASTFKLN